MMAKRKPGAGEGSESSQGFEAALERLEEIVERMEGGDLPLEEAIALFEEGVTLGQACSRRLDEAERKITVLLERADGSLEEAPFDEAAAEAEPPSVSPPPLPGAPRKRAPKAAPSSPRQALFDDSDDIPF